MTRAVHIAIFSALLFGCSPAEKIAVAETDAVADFERYFPSILGDYLSYPTHKALAVGRHADGRFVFAYRTTQRSKERAITVALDECQKRTRWIGLGVDCTLYASDNEVLEQRDEE